MWIVLVTCRGTSSDENLANRLRPGVSNSTKISSASVITKAGSSSTFQEELMRLIDPDVSLAELEHTLNRQVRDETAAAHDYGVMLLHTIN